MQLWVRHGNLMDLLMGLPGDTRVDATGVTDGQGKVVFRAGEFQYINFRSAKDGSLPHLYRAGSQWYIERVEGEWPCGGGWVRCFGPIDEGGGGL